MGCQHPRLGISISENDVGAEGNAFSFVGRFVKDVADRIFPKIDRCSRNGGGVEDVGAGIALIIAYLSTVFRESQVILDGFSLRNPCEQGGEQEQSQ
jgi:hypothetical protein